MKTRLLVAALILSVLCAAGTQIWGCPDPPCYTPGTPTGPSPASGAMDQVVSGVTLSWSAVSYGDQYAVYFGKVSPPPYVGMVSTNSYSTGTLQADTTYYWQVKAKNVCTGDYTWGSMSAEWDFTTVPTYSPYGMAIDSVTESAGTITVTTTGAKYVLSTTSMDMFRRIDPDDNDDAAAGDRKVATLDFPDGSIGTLSVTSSSPYKAIIDSTQATFEFQSDSFFFVTAKQAFDVTHTNLITSAPWNKGSGLDRMWTDGYGGSLLAHLSEDTLGTVVSAGTDDDATQVSLAIGDQTAHMVYPPKKFDFDGLYGSGSRPFVDFVYGPAMLDSLMADGGMEDHKDDDFGVYVVFSFVYDPDPGKDSWWPVLVEPGVLGYELADPDEFPDFIAAAQNEDFKVLAYIRHPSHKCWDYAGGGHQDPQTTVAWMKDFKEDYGFDGWYCDSASAGELIEDYKFIRQLRTDIGDDDIIYHHHSVDVWDRDVDPSTHEKPELHLTGRRAVMVDAYVNYTLSGEAGNKKDTSGHMDYADTLDNPYFKYFASGYGMSQSYSAYKRREYSALSYAETRRLLGENLNGCERWRNQEYWLTHFQPVYDIRKDDYLTDPNFDPDVDWPIDASDGWFRDATNVVVSNITSNSAKITWTTNSAADSEVTYSKKPDIENGTTRWWLPNGTVQETGSRTSHDVDLTGLSSGQAYEFKIRSNNGTTSVPGEIIWGYVGEFTTDS